jgi:lysyl-tRNA synthetase class 2
MNKKEKIIQENHYINEYEVRKNKAFQLIKKNLQAWSDSIEITSSTADLHKISSEKYNEKFSIAGRIVGIREHGKTIFFTIKDSSAKIQCYLPFNDSTKDIFNFFKEYFDLGDYISASGSLFVTKTGETTIRTAEIKMLSKCLHQIPDNFQGLNDIEIRYRQRYLDLLVHEEIKQTFIKRSLIIKNIREFLDKHGYMEVETPMLQPIPGGATARPFITHHNSLDTDFYLRIAPELYLKRLVVAGFEKVYEINRNFRNEGVSVRHNPEFTMLEFYTAHKDYNFAMNFTEELIRYAIEKSTNKLAVLFNNIEIDFSKPFYKMSPKEAVLRYGGFSEEEVSENKIDETLKKNEINQEKKTYYQKIFDLFETFAEKNIKEPVFIVNFPIEISPLSKRDPINPKIASRFELYIAGMEISNGFNELNDPFDQAERFKKQVEDRESGDSEAMYFDHDYINALEYGLPPTVGVGIGIDRLIMLATESKCIKDVILFPLMKPKI